MIKEIKDLETWTEANRWLMRHGYGLEQIREQKELWDKTKVVKTTEATTTKVINSAPTEKTTATKPVATKPTTSTK